MSDWVKNVAVRSSKCHMEIIYGEIRAGLVVGIQFRILDL